MSLGLRLGDDSLFGVIEAAAGGTEDVFHAPKAR
jgi:hypothetical protein